MTEGTLSKHLHYFTVVPLCILACGRMNWTFETGISMAEAQVPDWAISEAVASSQSLSRTADHLFCGPVNQP